MPREIHAQEHRFVAQISTASSGLPAPSQTGEIPEHRSLGTQPHLGLLVRGVALVEPGPRHLVEKRPFRVVPLSLRCSIARESTFLRFGVLAPGRRTATASPASRGCCPPHRGLLAIRVPESVQGLAKGGGGPYRWSVFAERRLVHTAPARLFDEQRGRADAQAPVRRPGSGPALGAVPAGRCDCPFRNQALRGR